MEKMSKGIFKGLDAVEATLTVMAAFGTIGLLWAIWINLAHTSPNMMKLLHGG
jgi:hypothetical protein